MLVVDPSQRMGWIELFNIQTHLEDNPKALEHLKFTKEGKLKKNSKEARQLDRELISILEESKRTIKNSPGKSYIQDKNFKKSDKQDILHQMTLPQAFQSTVKNTQCETFSKTDMEIQEEKSQLEISAEVIEMVKTLWAEKEIQKQKDAATELEIKKNFQEIQQLKNQLSELEDEVLQLKREKVEYANNLRTWKRNLRKRKKKTKPYNWRV